MNEEIENLKKIEFDRREKKLENAKKQKLIYKNVEKDKLHITYVMTWTGICGGTKIILEHANRLISRGHKITLITHDQKPIWFPISQKIEFIQVPWDEILCEQIPKCDLIITTYWREIYEAIEQKIAPVVYFEQGDYHLFEPEKMDERLEEFINNQLATVNFVYTVSNYAKQKLKERFNKEAIVIPNAVNREVFFYKEHVKNEIPTITIIGAEQSEFKRIKNILEAIQKIKEKGYKVNLEWITPVEPLNSKEKCLINPPQIEIGDILRRTDIFICASMYESFCLPVLEAMICGAAVITTNNGGNMDFIENGKNALIIEKDNIDDIINKIELLLQNEKLREELSKNAIITTKQYNWENIITKIEEYYREIAKYEVL